MTSVPLYVLGPREEDLIALFEAEPAKVGTMGRLGLLHLSDHSLSALLLASFYHDFFRELKKTEDTISTALLAYVDELMDA